MANPNRPAFGKITAATKWRRIEGRIKGDMVMPHLPPILGKASPFTGLDESKSAILSTMRLYLSLTTCGWMRSRHLIQEWLILDLDELACIELCCKPTLAKRRKHHHTYSCVYLCVLSVVSTLHFLFVTPRTAAHQASLSLGFSRQEYWSGLPCPPPGDFPRSGTETVSSMPPAWQADSFPLSPWGQPKYS